MKIWLKVLHECRVRRVEEEALRMLHACNFHKVSSMPAYLLAALMFIGQVSLVKLLRRIVAPSQNYFQILILRS